MQLHHHTHRFLLKGDRSVPARPLPGIQFENRVAQEVSALLPLNEGGQTDERVSPSAPGRTRERKRPYVPSQIFSEHWGITPQLWRELSEKKAIHAYRDQRSRAKVRGIPFTISLADWWQLWKESGKWELRGNGIGKYCMSRVRDQGGYELGNVYINLCQENSREACQLRTGKPRGPKFVYHVYPGRARAYLVMVKKVRLGFYETVEEAIAVRDAFLQSGGVKGKG